MSPLDAGGLLLISRAGGLPCSPRIQNWPSTGWLHLGVYQALFIPSHFSVCKVMYTDYRNSNNTESLKEKGKILRERASLLVLPIPIFILTRGVLTGQIGI